MKPIIALVSLAIIILFSSCSASYLEVGAFDKRVRVEPKGENYLVKKDGTKVFGDKIEHSTWGAGSITIDDQKFKFSEVKGYQEGEFYYAVLKNKNLMKRVVHGKINIYLFFVNYPRAETYAQKGEDGEYVRLKTQKQAAEMLADCPAAAAMINISNGQLRKEIKNNGYFLNEVFEMYNNGCKSTNHPKTKFYNGL